MVAAQPAAAASNRNRPPRMVLGTQRRASNAAMLQEFGRHGVERVWGYPPDPPFESGRGYWLASEVAQTKEFIESEPGLEMHAATLPFLGSTLIDREDRPAIMLGKSPERDRDIDDIHKCLEACAAAGVGLVKYNMSLTGVISTGEVELRGGSTTRQFRAADLDPTLPDTIAGKVSADDFWERIDYFLERVVPVAEELKVRIACHPQDPGTPPGGYRGVEENVLSTPGGKGLFKFLSLHPSPYHGLNLCVGTLAEMLWDPPAEIYDIVRRLARPSECSTFTSATSSGTATTSSRSGRTRATSITRGSSTFWPTRGTRRSSIPTTCPTMSMIPAASRRTPTATGSFSGRSGVPNTVPAVGAEREGDR